jgi:hypothetical protein
VFNLQTLKFKIFPSVCILLKSVLSELGSMKSVVGKRYLASLLQFIVFLLLLVKQFTSIIFGISVLKEPFKHGSVLWEPLKTVKLSGGVKLFWLFWVNSAHVILNLVGHKVFVSFLYHIQICLVTLVLNPLYSLLCPFEQIGPHLLTLCYSLFVLCSFDYLFSCLY